MYWRAGGVSGGLDRHPVGLTAEFLPLVMFVVAENWLLFEGGCCLREVEVGAAAKGKALSAGVIWFRKRSVPPRAREMLKICGCA